MIKVAAIIPDVTDGTSYYRGAGPLGSLSKTKKIEVIHPTTINWAALVDADVVFMQRPFNQDHLNMFNMAKDMGKKVVVDYDDDLFSLHPCNGAYHMYEDRNIQSNVRWMLRHADHVIISTEHLKNKWQQFTKAPITVVNNACDDNIQHYVGKPQPERELELAYWRGGPQHEVDINAYMSDMVSIVNDGKMPWILMGNPPWGWTSKLSHDLYEYKPVDDVVKYLKTLFQMNPVIGVAPLADIEFNKAKSNIGWIEATVSGAAYIAPKHLAEFNKPGVFHYGEKSIHEVFNLLLDNPDIRQKAQAESMEFIRDTLMLSKINEKRLEILS